MHKNTSTYHSIKLDRTYCPVALDFVDTASWCIAQLGNIAEGKGQLDLIRAVIALSRKGYFLLCYFVGSVADQTYKELLDRTVSESGFGSRFFFIPHTLNPYPIISEMDVVVSCARFEGLGRTLLEAILLEVPIIYANSGGPAQIFQDGVHGVSYEAGDFLQLAEALRCSITQNFAAHERAITAKNYVEACFTDTTFGGVVYDKLVQRLRLDEPLSRGTETPVLTLLKSKAVVT
jgi:glycosyltransferase involved in cell wall biosynthesis